MNKESGCLSDDLFSSIGLIQNKLTTRRSRLSHCGTHLLQSGSSQSHTSASSSHCHCHCELCVQLRVDSEYTLDREAIISLIAATCELLGVCNTKSDRHTHTHTHTHTKLITSYIPVVTTVYKHRVYIYFSTINSNSNPIHYV
jgi:hypothetical protein